VIEQRLSPGAQARLDSTDDTLVQVTFPVRLKVRDGRSWMATPDGKAATSSLPAGLRLEHLLRTDTPLAWADQRVKFGF
jgi:hypothetical protein